MTVTERAGVAAPRAGGSRVLTAMRMSRGAPDFLLNQARRLGPVVELGLLKQRIFLVTDPHDTHAVLVDQQTFAKGLVPTDSGSAAPLAQILGTGLLTSASDLHKQRRKLIQPLFHHERIAGYADTMSAEAQVLQADWTDGATVNVHAGLAEAALRILSSTVFEKGLSDADIGVIRDAIEGGLRVNPFRAVSARLLRRGSMPQISGETVAALKDLDALVYRLIAERRQSPGGSDLLSMLLAARDADTNKFLSDSDVRDEALTLLLAGHETTTNALSWALWLLAATPEVEAMLHAELDAVLPGARLPGMSDLASLPYTDAIVREAMRLFPPAWLIVRNTRRDTTIGGCAIPAGSGVMLCPYVTHRDPSSWPRADEFDPSRWLPGATESPHRDAYLPFGAGPRICIGNSFAMMESALVLATLASRWSFHATGRQPALEARVTLRPKNGMPLRVVAR